MRKRIENVTTSKGEKYRKVLDEVKKTKFALEGNKKLYVEREIKLVEKIYKKVNDSNWQSELISKREISSEAEKWEFDLIVVEAAELEELRKSGIAGFGLKTNGNLYYTEIPSSINFMGSNILGVHMCATPTKECKRFSALSDEEGGCAKVRNRSVGIERYDWITKGYETFNTIHDAFVVGDCLQNEM